MRTADSSAWLSTPISPLMEITSELDALQPGAGLFGDRESGRILRP